MVPFIKDEWEPDWEAVKLTDEHMNELEKKEWEEEQAWDAWASEQRVDDEA